MKKILILLWIVCFLSSGCSQEKSIKNLGSAGKNIICFGNSLTSGVGAQAGDDYPSLLAKQIDFPVINAGRAGDTTKDALTRIDRDVLNRDPKLVIVEFGGNDFLHSIPTEQTLNNLDLIVGKIQNAGAIVVLVEVKAGLIGDKYLAGFKKIAKQRGAVLIPDILKDISDNPDLKSDHIHPNEEGYKIMTSRILKTVKQILY